MTGVTAKIEDPIVESQPQRTDEIDLRAAPDVGAELGFALVLKPLPEYATAGRQIQLCAGRRLHEPVEHACYQAWDTSRQVLGRVGVLEFEAEHDEAEARGETTDRTSFRRGGQSPERRDVGARRGRDEQETDRGPAENKSATCHIGSIGRPPAAVQFDARDSFPPMEQQRPVLPLVDRVATGDVGAIARAISAIEAGGPEARALSAALYPRAGRALLVGLTGPPGAGKSTLVAQLVAHYRQAGRRVGVLAVDPSSPFSGGALLGDRVRMQGHALDSGVFVRSMATRGHLGGLAAATVQAADVLDVGGFDVIVIETVGVGQDEVDVARVADVCVVVAVPGAGDEVQAMKAGVMEIADVFVVNKADLDGADQAVALIEQSLGLGEASDRRNAEVVRVVATTGAGVTELVAAIDRCRDGGPADGTRRRQRAERRLLDALARTAIDRARQAAGTASWHAMIERLENRRDDPHAVAQRLLEGADVVGRLDHVGVATDAVASSLGFFGALLGLVVGPPEDVPSEGVRVRFIETGDARIEMIEASDDTSAFARSVRERGPGLHHIALRVDDLDATLEHLAGRGVRLVDRRGRPGAHGTRVAFIHPSSARGVLVELVERPRA